MVQYLGGVALFALRSVEAKLKAESLGVIDVDLPTQVLSEVVNKSGNNARSVRA